ncbi:MAG: carboxypeptidase regulatory-like domain-containing protein [Acidobacteriaceae bacterium]
MLVPAVTLFGQVDTGAIVGTIADQSGAVIPSAKVTITQESTNISTVARSDERGNYTSPPLRSGIYSVMVEAPGFESQTRTGITLQVQDRPKIDFKMAVGQVSDNVLVTGAGPAINTQSSALGQVVSSKMMTDLPLDGRDPMQLAALSTGVVMTSVGTNGNTGGNTSSGNNAGGLTSFAANGARGTLNNFLLDGIDNNSNDNGGPLLRTSVDALGEFKIQTNSFSAEFGRSGGAAINAVTKSGTNAYHGDVFEFFRNSALDARGYFEDPASKNAWFKQNRFGGTIGGPILRNKLFWFGDYQGNLMRGNHSQNLWFNIDAYSLPAPYTYGDARRNSLVGPGLNNFDGSLRKVFAIKGTQSIEFRAEAFNFLNHPNFAQPDPYIDDGPGAAGVITSTSLANREIQLALKYRF